MAKIPERWQEVISLSQRSPNHRNWHDDLRHCAEALGTVSAELAAAKSRIGELEQERGAEGTNWFPESFVSQLQAQLAAAQKENVQLRDNAWPQGTRPNPCAGYGCNGINVWGDEKSMRAVRDAFHYSAQLAEFREQWQAQLAAVTQERDTLKQENFTAHSLAMQWHQIWLLFSGAHYDQESWLAEYKKVFEVGEQIAQLQAHNKRLREFVLKLRAETFSGSIRLLCDAALTEEEKP